ncbi:hypothetical protein AMS68_005466 [Peltaster fructicola]|uniref:T6SS Phospholipase effector Tle1-like catalytic domain-containing protein n=1 Tax=Peltaster fructicola TaxID=286661 RepID=A0A6H0XZA7_9PEZI|nr:hypothetical protein AMS68_005466 [Peltaster fructicola]
MLLFTIEQRLPPHLTELKVKIFLHGWNLFSPITQGFDTCRLLPFFNPTTGQVTQSLACAGCVVRKVRGFYTPKELHDHIDNCPYADRLWKGTSEGTHETEELSQLRRDDSDTNVVKLFEMFDRRVKNQYHYYQPGIGTYAAHAGIHNVQEITLRARIGSVLDEMNAGSFAEHVLAGYKFLMRYYMEGDKVYIFGFSRGAYTARFLTELLDSVGLLSKGNEEMLPFLWYSYSQYRRDSTNKSLKRKLSDMSSTFCRVAPPKDVNEDTQRPPFVYFLGLWDCVNSVARLRDAEIDEHAVASSNIAYHIRHAVACAERRVMFLPTLFLHGDNKVGTCKEHWFAGNHGDVGGGWPRNGDDLLLSDIPLIWMVQELQEQERLDNDALQISWRPFSHNAAASRNTFEFRRRQLETSLLQLKHDGGDRCLSHDTMKFTGNGPGGMAKSMMAGFWLFLEMLPLKHSNIVWEQQRQVDEEFKRPLLKRQGSYTTKSTNWWHLGFPRRIPTLATIDPSVELLRRFRVISGSWKYGCGTTTTTRTTRAAAEFRYWDPSG